MKKKFVAVLLAIFAGGFGAHKFYLRQPELGVAYIALFIWLGRILGFPISFIIGWYDAYKLMTMDEGEFDRKYNSYFFRDRYGRRLERAKERHQSRTGRYVLLDEDADDMKKEKGYLKTFDRSGEAEKFKQSGIKKFKEYDTKQAIEDFKKALQISPNDRSLHFNIACAYSLEEKPFEAFYHLDKAVANGFSEIDKIKSHESLAYIRVLPEYELFLQNKFRISGDWLQRLRDHKAEEILILKQEVPIKLHNENI